MRWNGLGWGGVILIQCLYRTDFIVRVITEFFFRFMSRNVRAGMHAMERARLGWGDIDTMFVQNRFYSACYN